MAGRGGTWRRWCALLGLSLFLASGASPGARTARADEASEDAEATVKAAIADARRGLVAGLVELGEWCVSVKLSGQRDRLGEEILRIDPDHAKARAWLRYAKDRSGAWAQAKGYKPPADVTHSTQLPELARRRAALGTEAAALVVPVLARVGSAVPLRRRELVLDELLWIAPGDERVRAAHGDVRDGAGWVIEETMASRERRAALAAEAAAAVARVVEALPATPTSMERLFTSGVWERSYATIDLRIHGPSSLSSALVLRAVRLGQAARQEFTRLLGQEVPDIAGLTFFLYALPVDAYAFLDETPLLEDAQRGMARKLSCYWMPNGPHVLVYPNDDDTRIEWVPRVVVSGMLNGGFEVTPVHGFLFEGVGVWMTTRLTGAHRTFTVRKGEYGGPGPRDEGLQGRIQAQDSEWLAEARGLVGKGIRPELRLALGKDVNAMTAEDLIYAFALATYMFEARPGQVAPLLRAFPKGPVDAAVEGSLTLTVEGLEARFVRWLEETVPAPAAPPPPKSNPFGPRPAK